jgi:branched-chain amino acid transport system ATP-binding protein
VVLLEAQGLTKHFGGVKALEHVDISVEEGTIVGLIGPNGAGKTTLFNVVAGTFKPDSGRVVFAGEQITGLPANTICRRGIARTFQITRPFAEMTCMENVGVAVINRHRSGFIDDWQQVARETLAFVGLPGLADTQAKHLNVVQKKRLEIARALATEPKLLMLDEVLGGLNNQEIAQSIEFIQKLRDVLGTTIFWIEHVMGAIMKAAGKVIVLDQGEKLMEGTPEEVVNDPRVIQAYLGE